MSHTTRLQPRRIPPVHIALGGLALSVIVNIAGIAFMIHAISTIKQRDDAVAKMHAAIEKLKTPMPQPPDYGASIKATRDSLAALAEHQKQMTKALNDLTLEQSKLAEKLNSRRR